MPTAKLTSKGQITIPREVRDALRLRSGDRVAFHLQTDGNVVLEPARVDLMSLQGTVKTKIRGVTIEAINRAIRKAGSRQ